MLVDVALVLMFALAVYVVLRPPKWVVYAYWTMFERDKGTDPREHTRKTDNEKEVVIPEKHHFLVLFDQRTGQNNMDIYAHEVELSGEFVIFTDIEKDSSVIVSTSNMLMFLEMED